MAIPTFVAAGTASGSTGNATPGLPAGHAAGDLLLVCVESQSDALPPTVSGYAAHPESPQVSVGGFTVLWVFWKIDNGAESAPTVTDTGNHTYAVMLAFRGTDQTTPWNVSNGAIAGSSVTGVTFTGSDITTTVVDTLCLLITSDATDNASTTRWSNQANAALASIAERFDGGTTQGNGGGLGVFSGTKATAGAINNWTADFFVSDPRDHPYISTALQEPQGDLPILVDVGTATETELGQTITPVKPILVDVVTATEVELGQTIDPQINRLVAVGTATEVELGQTITPSVATTVAVGTATETELGQPVTPVLNRAVAVETATETELGQTVTPVKPILVDVEPAAEVELGLEITPFQGTPFLPGVTCEIITLGVTCETIRLAVTCETIRLEVECEVVDAYGQSL